ncbi:serine hydrolase [Leucobacter sp. CSA1]|uniref:Serine hydrolase n=1 Tax=Leucobacter chromiisoli TaxID=2796471 RepID=A0A934UVI0_9MICO|nr:serine hydrolase [Leucobacter chromiisoli]MBK0419496.1 serine hydrolase [Leucobacter chromiisoli]
MQANDEGAVQRRTVPGRRQHELGLTEAPTLDTWQEPRFNRWAFRHFAETVPTTAVSRIPLSRRPEPAGLDRVAHVPELHERLEDTYTDAILVQRGDEVLAEWYAPGFGPEQPHLLMSVSKSLLAIAFGALIDDGIVDPAHEMRRYAPDLAGSAFGGATVQQALDMLVSVEYSEDYDDPESEVQAHDRAANFRGARAERRAGDPQNVYEFLARLAQRGEHGRVFQYCSAVTDALAWVAENATGQRYAEVLSDRLWSQLGCAHDARIGVDRGGFAFANGGVECTARDLARVGRLMLDGGEIEGRRVVSEAWVAQTMAGGDPAHTEGSPKREVFPNFTYRNQWWSLGDARGSVHAVGIHGQYLWLDPASGTIIVKFSSAPEAVDYENTRTTAGLFADLIDAVS